jgi:hypothetical protein
MHFLSGFDRGVAVQISPTRHRFRIRHHKLFPQPFPVYISFHLLLSFLVCSFSFVFGENNLEKQSFTRGGGEPLQVGIKNRDGGVCLPIWAKLAAVIPTIDPTTNLVGDRPNAFPFCPSKRSPSLILA